VPRRTQQAAREHLPGTKAYDEALVESLAEAWHHLDQRTVHGEIFFVGNAPAERQAQQAALAMSPSQPRQDGGVRVSPGGAPAVHLHHDFRQRTGIHPWAFPIWN
jgi:hypothetical protein